MMNELNVITVPALDWDGRWHTAFTVYSEADGVLRTSSGWTLRDAIEIFCEWFKVDRGQIILERPFLPQRVLCDDCK